MERTYSNQPRCIKWIVSLLLLSLCLTLVYQNADAYPRKVLAEIFTNTHCPLCGQYIPPVERTLEEFYNDNYIFVTYHTWWPQIHDPWYIENFNRHLISDEIDDIITRVAYYGYDQFMGVPSFFFDGIRIRYGNPINEFLGGIRTIVDERLNTESPIHLEIETEINDTDLTTTIQITSDENLSNLDLMIALCEVYVEYNAPSRQTEFRGNVLDMIPTADGYSFNIPAGRTIAVDFESSLDVGWRDNPLENLQIIAWVHGGDLEVIQAERLLLGRDSPDILIIDASNNELAGAMVYELFGQGALPHANLWDRSEDGPFDEDVISNYTTVLYHSFNNNENLLTPGEEETLINFLDNGGDLVVSSPYLGSLNGNGLFYQGYLCVNQEENNLGLNVVAGIPDEPNFGGSRIHLGGEGSAGDPRITPSLSCGRGAEAVMTYIDDDNIAGIAAVKHETERYRTLTLAFPIESISGLEDTETREEFATRIWTWLNPDLSIGENVTPTAETIHLLPVYPNPFNSELVIPFQLDRPGDVTIELYNVTGQSVYQFAQGSFPAGSHQTEFNAASIGLISGIYFIRLNSSGMTFQRKVVYLR